MFFFTVLMKSQGSVEALKKGMMLKCKKYIISSQKFIAEFLPDSFRRALCPAYPFTERITLLLPLIQKIATFLSFSKKSEKACFFTIFVYVLKMPHTCKFKSAFGNQKCALKNNNSALFYFQHPVLFWARGKHWVILFHKKWIILQCSFYVWFMGHAAPFVLLIQNFHPVVFWSWSSVLDTWKCTPFPLKKNYEIKLCALLKIMLHLK